MVMKAKQTKSKKKETGKMKWRRGGEDQEKKGVGRERDEKENRRGLRIGGEKNRKIGGSTARRRRAGE